jgi:hypothetical protein
VDDMKKELCVAVVLSLFLAVAAPCLAAEGLQMPSARDYVVLTAQKRARSQVNTADQYLDQSRTQTRVQTRARTQDGSCEADAAGGTGAGPGGGRGGGVK